MLALELPSAVWDVSCAAKVLVDSCLAHWAQMVRGGVGLKTGRKIASAVHDGRRPSARPMVAVLAVLMLPFILYEAARRTVALPGVGALD